MHVSPTMAAVFDGVLITTRSNKYKRLTTLVVGKGEDIFQVPAVMLSTISPFFKAALSGDWKEATEDKVELPEESPLIFGIFLEWLFRSQMVSTGWEGYLTGDHDTHLVELYIFADHTQIVELKDAIIANFHSRATDLQKLPIPTLKMAFDETPEKCTLQQLIIAAWLEIPAHKVSLLGDVVGSVPSMAKILIMAFGRRSDESEERYLCDAVGEYLEGKGAKESDPPQSVPQKKRKKLMRPYA
ncbi:hypothetical protein BDZ85DRAFT_114090 [Elsinoe ampelina]|uniref:BTB domain-containing protein n=1 Tax=Elsinoe ampelina TaxID=302913 RepID=A0A6A6GDG9_9PEZI|nr:hypothetical protein BDZ85DRAFT_114090 [Elsinoe ampelina]